MGGVVSAHHNDEYGRPLTWLETAVSRAEMGRTDFTEHEVKALRAALDGLFKIGACCGNSNFEANAALGLGRVAHWEDRLLTEPRPMWQDHMGEWHEAAHSDDAGAAS